MKIIKAGNLEPHVFRCAQCGCEFEADFNEYSVDTEKVNMQNCLDGDPPKIMRLLEWGKDLFEYRVFSCTCPCCKLVVEDRERTR